MKCSIYFYKQRRADKLIETLGNVFPSVSFRFNHKHGFKRDVEDQVPAVTDKKRPGRVQGFRFEELGP